MNNEYHPYIGCVHGTADFLQKHHYSSVKGHTSIDIDFLEQLFNDSILPSQEECAVIEPLTSRRKYCGMWSFNCLETACVVLMKYLDFDHIQGPGRLEHLKCDVTFTALVPVDPQDCPYVVFTSQGIHKHPPPPPHKPPELILRGVQNIIRQMRNPSLTRGIC